MNGEMLECPEWHRLNRAENWLNGEHCSGVVQCGTCGHKYRYDINFNVHWGAMDRRFSERVNGKWRSVAKASDLVFEFEEQGE